MPSDKPSGLREQNKSDKLRRIRLAARALFAERGFEDASMREIAQRAHVGLATLFLYAENKRDLLFLAYSDDLDALAHRPFDELDTDRPLLDQLIAIFGHFFALYAQNRELARALLREIAVYTSGRQSDRFHATREATVAGVEQTIRICRQRGAVAPSASDTSLAHLVFDVFTCALRRWLGGEGTSDEGLADLRDQFAMLIEGFGGPRQDRRGRS